MALPKRLPEVTPEAFAGLAAYAERLDLSIAALKATLEASIKEVAVENGKVKKSASDDLARLGDKIDAVGKIVAAHTASIQNLEKRTSRSTG